MKLLEFNQLFCQSNQPTDRYRVEEPPRNHRAVLHGTFLVSLSSLRAVRAEVITQPHEALDKRLAGGLPACAPSLSPPSAAAA